MLRRGDVSKRQGVMRDLKQDVDALKGAPGSVGSGEEIPAMGLAIVQDAIVLGDGCLCEVEILSNGVGSGQAVQGAVCHSAQLAVGAVVAYVRHADGTVEIMSGGGGGTSTVVNNTGTTIDFFGPGA